MMLLLALAAQAAVSPLDQATEAVMVCFSSKAASLDDGISPAGDVAEGVVAACGRELKREIYALDPNATDTMVNRQIDIQRSSTRGYAIIAVLTARRNRALHR